MKKLFSLIVIGFVFSGILFLVGCQKKVEEKKVVKIGAILPLTGDGAIYGNKEKNGIELAILQENNKYKNNRFKAVYEDSRGDPSTAVSAIRKLLAQKIKVVIGGAFSSPTLAMIPVINQNKVLLISPTASSPKLSGASRYFFRVWPSDTREAAVTAEIAVNRLHLKTFAIIYGNNDYAIGLRDEFIKTVKELGGKVVTIENYNEGDTNFRTQLLKIKDANPDAIYMVGYFKEFALILIQAKEMGIDKQFLSCGTFHEPKILKLTKGAAEGVVFVQPYFSRKSKDIYVQKFVKEYEKKFKIKAGVYAAHGYDAAKVALEAIVRNNFNLDADKLRYCLLNYKDFPGVTGKIRFTETGDVIKAMRVMTVKNGKFVDLH